MKLTPQDGIEAGNDQLITQEVTNGILPFIDQLYDDGDPTVVSGNECSHTPLYDTLRGLDQRYAEQTLIATGGMKEIYRALDLRTSRYVAIARPIQSLGKDHYDAFLREAHITAKLEHPGIIKLFGMDIDENGKPFFTMELKNGHSLREIINDYKKGRDLKPWRLSQRLSIILRICESLSYAHSNRVLHLDIKPENIQVGSFGEVQLCDWGMGIVIKGDKNGATETLLDPDLYGSLQRNIKGTPAYMAPELFDARNSKTEQMDIYALGHLIEELINTQPKESNQAPLRAVVEKAMAQAPNDRYSSVSELQHDITRYLDGFIMSVEPSSLRRELSLFYRRQRKACNITLSFLLISIAAVTLFLDSLSRSRNEARQSRDHALSSLAALEKEQLRSETRLKNQVKYTQIGSSDLIHLELVNKLNLETLTNKLYEQIDGVLANKPPDNSGIWTQKFWLDFLTQRFDSAFQLHKTGKTIPKDLQPLAQKYASRIGGEEYLSTDDFTELISELFAVHPTNRMGLAEKMIYYDLKNPRTTEERATIVKHILTQLNPTWKKQTFTYSSANHSLKISGNGLARLAIDKPRQCILTILNPRKLDIRGSSITHLEKISTLNLAELDLRQTPVTSIIPLRDMKTLSRVIVSHGQFPEKQLDELPSFIEVIVRE